MSGDQSAGRSHNTTFDNSSLERMEQLRYLEVSLTYQNSVQEEIKSRLNCGIACYHSVQNFCLPVCYGNIQGVTGGMCETSGECSLGQTIPI